MKRLLAALVLALSLAGTATVAQAAPGLEATFQDDNQLIYVKPGERNAHLDSLKALGVDRLRVTILWRAIAPSPSSRTRPRFDATDPAAYPSGTWSNYDALVREAYARGLKVNFNLTGPSPLWANKRPPRPDIADNYEPSPSEFAQFVAAVGRRYSGTYSDRSGGILPRVDYWSIWNEPNHSGWLTPTWQKVDGRFVERSASLYRELLDGAYAALKLVGHGSDTILFGDTAPSGWNSKDVKRFMKPLTFLRALYCVDGSLHRLKGAAARRLNCPANARDFVTAHPALFKATGYAHHPYQLLTAPDVKPSDKDFVTMAVLSRLTHTLDTVQRRYGSHRRFPIYLTEFGYQTPPDPAGVPLSYQAAFINEAEYIAYHNPRVRTLSQFLLVDSGAPIHTTFQSGLVTRSGRRKPAFAAYRVPIWVRGKGSRKRVWALLRPAAPGARATGIVQFRPAKSARWRTVRRVRSRGASNVITTTVTIRGKGSVRVAYGRLHSRGARVG
ncbi:MAG: hypothetical protein ACR2NB_07365 [Solirubrobacteraceae bacterium]